MMPRKRLTIDSLELNNFKRFYGHTAIDLSTNPDSEQTLVLIGAENGRGKTSIQEAILHVFYGDKSYPGMRGRDHYLKEVSDRLNRRALDERATDFYVAMNLTVDDYNSSHKYRLVRTWDVDIRSRRAVGYKAQLYEDGTEIKPTTADDSIAALYDDFVWSLMPPQVAHFFFFDGEMIQKYADKGFFGEDMAEAIQNILGIKIYKTLREDIKRNVIEYIDRTEVKDDVADELFKLRQEARSLERDIDRARSRQGEILEQRQDLERQREFTGNELISLFSPHQAEREELIAEQHRLEAQRTNVQKDIEKAFSDLPLLLTGSLAEGLRSRLSDEQHAFSQSDSDKLRSRIQRLEEEVVQFASQPLTKIGFESQLTSHDLNALRQCVRHCAFAAFELNQSTEVRLHDIGDGLRQAIQDRLQEVRKSRFILKEALDLRERIEIDYRDTDRKLQSTTDDPQSIELGKKRDDLTKKLGGLEQAEKALRAEILKLDTDLTRRNQQIETREQKQKTKNSAIETIRFARTIQDALQEFAHRLSVLKLKSVESQFLEMYSLLRKEEDPWHSVEVDKSTYEVVLKDRAGRRLERNVFSAGMKEMYALSLLWALGRSSGRQLPVVIDTPMGRLDRRNREALFDKYLPKAGHQVIILSTDTEVDTQWASRLEPFVARQYHLGWDSATDGTVVKPGYFF